MVNLLKECWAIVEEISSEKNYRIRRIEDLGCEAEGELGGRVRDFKYFPVAIN